MSRDAGHLHIFAWRGDNDGPYYVGSAFTLEQGVSAAEYVLKENAVLSRAEIKDVRAGEVVWSSAVVRSLE